MTAPNPIPLDSKTPIDPENFREVFSKLQGNIVKGHGRDFTANIFFSFGSGGSARLREQVAALTRRYVTSATEQFDDSAKFKKFQIPGRLFGNFFLSARGYVKLGFEAELATWFKDEAEGGDPFPQHASFLDGMKAAAEDFHDALSKEAPSPLDAPLEAAYKNGNIDALLLLADDGEQNLLREARAAIDLLEKEMGATVRAVELGRSLRNDDGEGIEHFGYVDGRSQPLFLESDFDRKTGVLKEQVDEKAKRRESGDIDIWNPLAPLKLVLKADPGVENDPEAFGSYYVFRKLEQNVLGFSIAEQRLADALELKGEDRDRAGAMAVGRFRDGTPLTMSETDGAIPAKSNNFRFDGLNANLEATSHEADERGLKCPFHAHIRKTNPRQSVVSFDPPSNEDQIRRQEERDRNRRIVRRGIPYGTRTLHPKDPFQPLEALPKGDVGLLFACFQSSIVQQFSFMQKTWVNNINFHVDGTQVDPLIGQSPARETNDPEPPQQHWRSHYGVDPAEQPLPPLTTLNEIDLTKSHKIEFRFSDFIRFRGGEFFFAPSLPFLLSGANAAE